MTILGVQSLVYGTDKVEDCIRFYEHFGLELERKGDFGADFRLAEGSSIIIRRDDDPSLPAAFTDAPGAREVVWGVDGTASLNAIEKDLSGDRAVRRDDDGTLHTVDDQGIAIGFRVFDRNPPAEPDIETNAPGAVRRWDRHRKWFDRAAPKVINHVVFAVPDVDKAVAFYTGRLGFRLTDVSRGLGVFMRCDGRNEHHNLFFLKSQFMNRENVGWHHVCFGVENVDEMMVGGNYMQHRGWASPVGIGRHRIASALFYYMPFPGGGEAEYGADTDYLTDDWKPRLWDPMFGNFNWVGRWPEWAAEEHAREVRTLESPIPTFSELSAETV